MTDTGALFAAVSIPTVVSLVGLVWSQINASEFRSELRAIWNEIILIRERLTRIETTLGLAPIAKQETTTK
jgi:hypothetical protein